MMMEPEDRTEVTATAMPGAEREFRVGVGVSHHRNARMAGGEAARQALADAGIDRADFVFLFGTIGYDQQALVDAVRSAVGDAPLVGCCCEGIIGRGEADESNFGVSVTVLRSDALRLVNGVVTGLSAGAEEAGRKVAEAIAPHLQNDARALLLFPDGLTMNFDRFNAGLQEALKFDGTLPLIGGTSGENFTFTRTYQYCDGRVLSDSVVFVLLSGDVRIAWGARHGCVPVGAEHTVTSSSGNIIYEIDGKPVREALEEYTGGDMENWGTLVMSLSFGLKTSDHMVGYDDYLVRAMTSAYAADGSIAIPTEIAPGTGITIMHRDQEKIRQSVADVAAQLREQMAGAAPKFVLHFECAGRGQLVLRDNQKVENLTLLRESLGSDVPWAGLFCYGEIAPVAGRNCFHNWSAVLLAIY